MSVYQDDLIELEARAIVIRCYMQMLVRGTLDPGQVSSVSNAHLEKLHRQVAALEPLARNVGRLRDLLDETEIGPAM